MVRAALWAQIDRRIVRDAPRVPLLWGEGGAEPFEGLDRIAGGPGLEADDAGAAEPGQGSGGTKPHRRGDHVRGHDGQPLVVEPGAVDVEARAVEPLRDPQ